jgi:thioredoxin 2
MLEGVVQVVCPPRDRDNRLPRDRLCNAPPCVACRGVLFERRPEPLDDNDIPLLAVLHTAWSGESRTLQSAFEQAAVQLEPCVRLPSVDGAALPDLVARLKVVRYPTLLLMQHERELARKTGAMNLAQLLAWARPLIAAIEARPI